MRSGSVRPEYRVQSCDSETGYSGQDVGPWRRGRMRGRFGFGAVLAALVCALVLAACGGDDGGGGGGGGGSSSSASSGGGDQQTTKGAKVIDPNSMNGAKGNVTYCV